MKILVLTRYGTLGASSRLRFEQYSKLLANENIELHLSPLIGNEDLLGRYKYGRYSSLTTIKSYLKRLFVLLNRKNFDLLWIEKELFPWLPSSFELFFLKKTPFVLDFDDAVFHNYDLNPSGFVRRLLGPKFKKIAPCAALIISGNEYLDCKLKSFGAKNTIIIPTVIDLERYPEEKSNLKRSDQDLIRVVWIGSPSTVKYIEQLKKPLLEVFKRNKFIFRVIGAEFQLDDIIVEQKSWSIQTEVEYISECDIGIMPLMDSPWEKGKCGYKLIQYMACGLPVIASPVGVNNQIVSNERNGFLSSDDNDWVESLVCLINDESRRKSMGANGRALVEDKFCIQVTAKNLSNSLLYFSNQKNIK